MKNNNVKGKRGGNQPLIRQVSFPARSLIRSLLISNTSRVSCSAGHSLLPCLCRSIDTTNWNQKRTVRLSRLRSRLPQFDVEVCERVTMAPTQ